MTYKRVDICAHVWICICMDDNDALYRCQHCGLYSDGFGHVWSKD